MGHKAVAVFDLDVLDLIDSNPIEFARRFKIAILNHRQIGGFVSIGGETVANVVWSGHADLAPVLKFTSYGAENVTYSDTLDTDDEIVAKCQSLLKVGGRRVEAIKLYRTRFNCDFKTAMRSLGLSTPIA